MHPRLRLLRYQRIFSAPPGYFSEIELARIKLPDTLLSKLSSGSQPHTPRSHTLNITLLLGTPLRLFLKPRGKFRSLSEAPIRVV
jgi:hypothetical protein